jgi:transcriptional regulator with AAA-type ATPase domain/tetratricopeptide (TPR) repeat protein
MADLDELVGQSPAIESVRNDLRRLLAVVRAARRLPSILIQGETGTGKGLVAKLLHRHGPRARGPFVDLNCAAIPETLLEGELFGYERGAFTDARRAKPGLFQTSTGGVLFLDEVALFPETLQAKLLTAIEEQSVRRLGSTAKETFDAWLISATNTDLERAVRDRRFREDLYHRLAVLSVRLPPLRERAGDAVLLAQRFLERACHHYGLPAKTLTADARALVASDPWRGNVRELANVAERLVLLVDGSSVTAADFEIARGADCVPPTPAATAAPLGGVDREQLLAALEATGWNIMRTASRLGVSRNTIRAHMDRFGLRTRRIPDIQAPVAGAPSAHGPGPTATSVLTTAPPTDAVRWERRHVSMLRVAFAGPADASLYASHLLSLAAEKARGFGGRVEGLGRTQLDASFGAVPIENAARRAVSAAVALHKSILDAARPDLAATTVIHAQQTTVGLAGSSLVIDEADRAALTDVLHHLLEDAEPGVVEVSAATAPFLERHFELRAAQAPGAAEPSFIVVRPDPTGLGAWRRLNRFVGRQAEMDVLRSRWELARGGRGQVVGLVGEPGVGKSRLLLEFTRTLDQSSARVLRMATSATEDPSRGRPAAALLGSLFAIEPGDRPSDVHERMVARLRALDLEPELLPPLAALLDVEVNDETWKQAEPQQRARRTRDALRRLIVRESLVQPVVIALEDLHWIDPDTQVTLDHLIEIVPAARILFVAAYRPEYRHDWAGKTFYTQLRIDPLPSPAASLLLDDLLGVTSDIEPLKTQLLAWTEGNPFFIEEAVRTLVETGGLSGTPGAYRATGKGVAPTLPATVEDTLAARIHRLPADVRQVLQCGAAIGVEFSRALLASLAGIRDEALAVSLRALEDAEFVYPVIGASAPAHTFKHALTHLVTYRSLPPERQRALHAEVLSVLETLHAGQLEAHVEALAEHAFRAEMWERAAGYLQTAGTRALARTANRTAVDHLERAIAAFDRADHRRDLLERAIDVRLDLRYALMLVGQPERMLPRLREAEAMAGELGDTARLGRVVSFLANGLYLLGDHTAAIASARRAMAIARRLDDFPTRVTADIYAGRALQALGRYEEATQVFRGVVDALTGEHANEHAGLPVLPAAYARTYLVMGLTELGDFTSAVAVGREAISIADATGHLDTIQWACYAMGVATLDRGDAEGAIGHLERALSICRAAELPVYVPRTAAALGHAYALVGRMDGLTLLESAVTDSQTMPHRNVQARILARLAEVYVLAGKSLEAEEPAACSLAIARERGLRGSEAHALRALAGCYEAQSRLPEARTLYEAALALGNELGMRHVCALCHLGLGRLQRAAARPVEARRHLTTAQEAFAHLGMARWHREASAELALLG